MDTLRPCLFSFFFFFFFFPFTFFTHTALSVVDCKTSSCGEAGPKVRFPFRLKRRQPKRCGYPGFDLSCNNQSQTVLTLPDYGELIVKWINYDLQEIHINTDPDFCLPEKILKINLLDTPFRGVNLRNYKFLNCSSGWSEHTTVHAVPLFCLSGNNYTIVAMTPYWYSLNNMSSSCRVISTVSVPVSPFTSYMNLSQDLQLMWVSPRCWNCEAEGICGYDSDTGMGIGCSKPPSQGLPRSAKYGIIIGVGIPAVVCITGFACYICGMVRDFGQRHHPNTELSTTTIASQPAIILTGLDGPTIASFPKTLLGESRRLPNPNDGTCPICLSEYQPKETLRTIPECNHYFHASCIDEWLSLNATCPLCRNSPDSRLVATTSSSVSFSSSLSSSSSSSS
ncbi:unnamed protein product [Ilex paraguariensis]|uniref:RING-type E3 ubiquitin transferase n=1 Tax=Ilex paraguariensis TaxID=185542 RepID=A0ABC8T4R4_9AQUA